MHLINLLVLAVRPSVTYFFTFVKFSHCLPLFSPAMNKPLSIKAPMSSLGNNSPETTIHGCLGSCRIEPLDQSHLMMMPFSTEKLSVGNPAMFHSLIFTCSPSVLIRLKSGEHGSPFSCTVFSHSWPVSWEGVGGSKYFIGRRDLL